MASVYVCIDRTFLSAESSTAHYPDCRKWVVLSAVLSRFFLSEKSLPFSLSIHPTAAKAAFSDVNVFPSLSVPEKKSYYNIKHKPWLRVTRMTGINKRRGGGKYREQRRARFLLGLVNILCRSAETKTSLESLQRPVGFFHSLSLLLSFPCTHKFSAALLLPFPFFPPAPIRRTD